MRRKLPPLASLATAEAVAQEQTFTAAAKKLNVTPSAISHQMRALEEWLGFALFRRDVRSVRVTDDGAAYLQKVSTILNNLETMTLEVMEQAGKQKQLRIQTTDSLASRWLVSRLPDFQTEYPLVSVSVVTREYTEGYRPSDADIAILYGRGDWASYASTLLLSEWILPVCSPAILRNDRRIVLCEANLLHDDNLGITWSDWISQTGTETSHANLERGIHFNHSHLALQAAEHGAGVVLASLPLVVDALRSGKLIAPFEQRLETGSGYYIVQCFDGDQRKRTNALVAWLTATERE